MMAHGRVYESIVIAMAAGLSFSFMEEDALSVILSILNNLSRSGGSLGD